MSEKLWRFKGNNYTSTNGLNTADMETFKKDPVASLAREICQNSIDAKAGIEPVLVQFKSFVLKKESIPNVERVIKEIESCINHWQEQTDIRDELKQMLEAISNNEIHCLRISDFNTIGLDGVDSNDMNTPFYLLTKGSGVTDKYGAVSKGGSKGIGKFASFVASSFNTVFYSTLNKAGKRGYLGICKLCSSSMEGTDELTQGTGYFSDDDKNTAIQESFSLDKDFNRSETGTDIFILGFDDDDNWINDIITKVLDSFMCAIQFNRLIVDVNGVVINSSNLKDVVYSDYINKKMSNSIRAQYNLLNDEDVFKTEVDIYDYGKLSIYLKGYKKEEANLATNNCVMVRYPFMKIKHLTDISSIPCSALAIIDDNGLNKMLRKIENPQHDDWQPKREKDKDVRSEINSVIREMRKQIVDFITEKLSSASNKEADIEGAGDFLPEESGDVGTGNGEEVNVVEKPVITKPVEIKNKDKNPSVDDEEGNGLQPDIGDHEEGEGSPVPGGNNEGGGGTPHDSDDEEGSTDGDKEILRLVQIRDAKCRFIALNISEGKFVVYANCGSNEQDCDFEIYELDDSNEPEYLTIISCKVNGIETMIENGKATHFKLNSGKNKIEFVVDVHENFGSEVRLYARR